MPTFKEMDPELAWRAIEGHVDVLKPSTEPSLVPGASALFRKSLTCGTPLQIKARRTLELYFGVEHAGISLIRIQM